MKRCTLHWVACGSCSHPEFMTQKSASLCPTDFPSHVAIICHPDHGVILFDTGYDPEFLKVTRTFPECLYRWTTPITLGDSVAEKLLQMGFSCDDVSAVVISHFHGDHVSGLHHFPNARIFCSKMGLDMVRKGNRFTRICKGLLSSLVPVNIEERSKYFEDFAPVILPSVFSPFTIATDLLGDGSLLAIELPGHCAGHWGMALRTQGDRYIILVADAVWNISAIEKRLPPPRITTAFLGNTNKYRETLSSLHDLYKAQRDVILLPSHCKTSAYNFKISGS